MIKNTLRSVSVLVIFLVMLPAPLCAWDNNYAHPQITQKAIELFLKTLEDDKKIVFKGDKERLAAFKEHIFYQGGEQCKFIDEGSVKEDMGKSPKQTLPFSWEDSWDIKKWGDNDCHGDKYTWLSHAYHPVSKKSWDNKGLYDSLVNDDIKYEHALHRSIRLWKNMINFKNSPDAQENRLTYFTLGRLCHLVQDMTSPAHVHADFHGTGDDVEEYAKQHIDEIMSNLPPLEIKKPTTHGLRIEHPYIEDLRKDDNIFYFIKNIAFRTYRMTSYYGGKLTRETGDAQPDSELKRMFPYNNGKGLNYDKGNQRYSPGEQLRYDPGGFIQDSWIINNVGRYWVANRNNNDWWECPEDPGYYYLEDIDGIIPEQFKSKQHSFERIDATNLDSLEPNTLPLRQLYAERLFPLAVEWTAGLLQALYFQVTGPKDFEKKACKCRPWDPWPGIDKNKEHFYSGVDSIGPYYGRGAPSGNIFQADGGEYMRKVREWQKSFAKTDCTCYFEEGERQYCDCYFDEGLQRCWQGGTVSYCD